MKFIYRRDGTPYPDTKEGMLEFERDFIDRDKKIVKQDKIGRYFISTVWLGIDHSFNVGKPLIFESMVFNVRKSKIIKGFGGKFKTIGEDIIQQRYSSLDDAIAGHGELVKQFKKKKKIRHGKMR